MTDLSALRLRLAAEEKELLRELAQLEDQLRRFEDQDRPDYEAWRRLVFSPRLGWLEEIHEQIRVLRILVHRIESLTEDRGLHPREALYVARGLGTSAPGHPENDGESREKSQAEGDASARGYDPDEIEARRRARQEAKREARREQKADRKREQREQMEQKEQKEQMHPKAESASPRAGAGGTAANPRSKILTLYRFLARKLHPDSSQFIASDRAQRLWLEVQAAYETADYERLLSVAAWLGQGDPHAGSGPSETLSDRYERIRSLGISRHRLRKSVARMAAHPAWEFGLEGPENGKKRLKKQTAREIERELARAQEALAAYEDFVASIGPPKPPGIKRRG